MSAVVNFTNPLTKGKFDMNRIAGVLLIAVFVFAWLFRWELGGHDEDLYSYKINRWTGNTWYCDGRTCYESENSGLEAPNWLQR